MKCLCEQLNDYNKKLGKIAKDTERIQFRSRIEHNFTRLNNIVRSLQSNNKVLKYMMSELEFVPSERLKKMYGTVAAIAKGLLENERFEETSVNQLMDQYEKYKSLIEQEWKTFYETYTKDSLAILKVLKGTDPQKIEVYISRIKAADHFTLDEQVYQKLKESIEQSADLIQNAGLDEEITLFLKKVNKGTATLNDLSDEVYNWVKKQDLLTKIKISFKKM